MYSKISVLVPTRGRPLRLRRLLVTFDQTQREGAELVFRVDDDDTASLNLLLEWGAHKVVVGPRGGGYRDLPMFFNEMYAASSGDVLMLGNDDMAFETLNWPSLLLSRAASYPDGLFDLGVHTHNEGNFPFACVSRKACDRLGFIADPRIHWVDMFWRDAMAAFGRAVMVPEVSIAHEWAGFTPDTTFLEGDCNGIYRRQPDYWNRVHAPVVADAVERLKEMVAA